MSVFLEKSDVAILTGRKSKTGQIDALRKMGIPFFINACGCAVVTRSAVEGRFDKEEIPDKPWTPAVLQQNGARTNSK
ncbi:MAG: DUF4224 domain-containing protein [Gammaproteobacteria bacterium]|jgi:hypothetical protein|nr:DUF4224 domain-containing protein [Pseudomonadota bacterium]QOJ20002.1 MAG: DUF4224 domain-containing protein [Gammaproteobacteria bacterium]